MVRSALMLVRTGLFRFTRPASGSVPVLTAHRSTPQVGLLTVKVMGAGLLRPCPSATVAGMYLAPVVSGAAARKVNTLSPGVASPLLPSSKNCCEALPPMAERSPVTVIPVLGGVVAGVTRTMSSVVAVASSDEGEAVPKPEGMVGSPPHTWRGATLLRGMGPMAAKSFRLLSVSTQPLPLRRAAVVLSRVPTGVFSEQFVPDPPYPTKSAMAVLTGQAPERAVVVLTSATLPEAAPMLMVPVTSGEGRSVVPPAPGPSWI